MPQPIITVRDNVNRHKKELAEVPFVMHNSGMGSDSLPDTNVPHA
jgi:hypothetical protein